MLSKNQAGCDVIVWKKLPFHHLHGNTKMAFTKMSTLESVFEKSHFRWPFILDTCGRKVNPHCVFNENGYVWTGSNIINRQSYGLFNDQIHKSFSWTYELCRIPLTRAVFYLPRKQNNESLDSLN